MTSLFEAKSQEKVCELARSVASLDVRSVIDGRRLDATGAVLSRVSGATGQPLVRRRGTPAEVGLAVRSARKSFEIGSWRSLPTQERSAALNRVADIFSEQVTRLAVLDAVETNRSVSSLYSDAVPKAIETLRWFADNPPQAQASVAPGYTRYRHPLGVIGAITAWNDPLVLAVWKVAPALMSGNSIVVKPSENSCLTTIELALAGLQAGIPAGVFNVVVGDAMTGEALVRNSGIDGLSFTGSAGTAFGVVQVANASRLCRVSVEAGGKSPSYISESANLLMAATAQANAIFYHQGQICSAASRLLIHEKVYDAFLEELVSAAAVYVPKDPLQIQSRVGGLVTEQQYMRVNDYISIARAQNAVVSQVGNAEEAWRWGVPPTIIEGLRSDSPVYQEEIFGPVVVAESVRNVNEALEAANNSSFGLAAGIWSESRDEILQFVEGVVAGIVHINSFGDDVPGVPFGGVRNSGNSKEKSLETYMAYTYEKSVWPDVNQR